MDFVVVVHFDIELIDDEGREGVDFVALMRQRPRELREAHFLTVGVSLLIGAGCVSATCLWLSGLRAKQGMRPLLAHEVRPCLVCGDAVLEVGEGQTVSRL